MQTHIKVVAWLHIVFPAFTLLTIATISLIGGGFAAWLAGEIAKGAQGASSADVRAIMSLIGAIVVVGVVAMSVGAALELAAGIALLKFKPWGRIVTLIFSFLGILGIPVGTAISIYSIWALLHRDAKALFGPAPIVQPSTVT